MNKNLKDDGTLVKDLIVVQGILLPIVKTKENDFTKVRYLDLPELLRVAKPVLTEHNILLQQFVDLTGDKATVNTFIMNPGGEFMSCGGTLPPTQMKGSNSTQWLGASVTYLRRFQALTILGLIGADDDDESNFKESDTPDNAPPADLNGPTGDDQRQQVIDAIKGTAEDAVFSDKERMDIKTAYMNARTLAQLQKVLADVHAAYNDKTGGSAE